MSYWKILRILTTNQCNYQCLYCHNEGQEKLDASKSLTFDDFLKVEEAIRGSGFQEIRFSGGEPLINPETIRMIEWLNAHTEYEIGLATNGSMVTEEIARRLGNTRTLVTMHLPAMRGDEYKRVTGNGKEAFFKAIDQFERYQVQHSFNYVLYPNSINNLEDVVNYVAENGKRVKLLPFIEEGFHGYSKDIIESIKASMDAKSIKREESVMAGIISWTLAGGGRVKLLNSPCYDHSIERCREYGELRLLPNLSLQKCIFDKATVSVRNMTVDEIRETITDLWNSFNEGI